MSVAALRTAAGSAACLLTFLVASASAQGYPTMLQISPKGGGRCIEVPDRDVIQGQGLQMAECNSTAAQIFVYDPAGMHLTIGGLCVDANGGKPGDLVKLWPCEAGANQIWKSEQKGNFTKLVGESGLCLDIRYGSTEDGAPVQSWNCGDSEPNQLWIFQRE
jgi:Ricin-type beta-trefoil lectin domain